MSGYLLDTSTIIWVLRGRKDAIQLLEKLSKDVVPGCSILSVYEVLIGARPGEEEKTRKFLNSLTRYPVDDSVVEMAALAFTSLRGQGVTLDPIDAMIGATCLVHDQTLVTYNAKHFPLEGLKMIDASFGVRELIF